MKQNNKILRLILFCILTSCGSGGEPLSPLSPKIAIDICKTPLLSFRGKNYGGTKDCLLDIGEIATSQRYSFPITVSNLSGVPLLIKDIKLESSTHELIIDPVISVVNPGQSIPITIRARSTSEENLLNVLHIRSNAVNANEGEVTIKIVGKSVNRGFPRLAISNPICDFGAVSLHQTANCKAFIKNLGVLPLEIDRIEFTDNSSDNGTAYESPFSTDENLNSIITVNPNSEHDIDFKFSPHRTGNYSQYLHLLTNDPRALDTELLLRGQGITLPQAQCAIKSINEQTFQAGDHIQPLDRIILSGAGSYALDPATAIHKYHWRIVEKPVDSHVEITATESEVTELNFYRRKGIDLAGEYTIELIVEDDLGSASTPCQIKFKAIPKDELHIQLVWEKPFGDMDLHLAKLDELGRYCVSGFKDIVTPGSVGQRCAQSIYEECNYTTCRKEISEARKPDWQRDGTQIGKGDPRLDIDARSGFGPENINIEKPLQGSYLVSVHYFSTSRESIPNTVRIYIFGEKKLEVSQTLQQHDWWDVAIIHWPINQSGYPTIQSLSD